MKTVTLTDSMWNSIKTELRTEDAVLDMLADAHEAGQWVLVAPDGRTWVSDNIQLILAAVAAEFDGAALPRELFDGFAVLQELTPQARKRTGPENVGDVLDAVVRMIRARSKESNNG